MTTLRTHQGFFQRGVADTDLSDYNYEDFLVADRAGLVLLRSKIDEETALSACRSER